MCLTCVFFSHEKYHFPFPGLLSFHVQRIGAERIEADFFAVNVDTGFGFPLNDGTRLDHNSAGVDVSKLDIRVSFNWPGSSIGFIEDHIDRVEWTVQHSGRSYSTSHTTNESVDGEWSMCGGRRCRALQSLGSVTINARAIYDDGRIPPVVHPGG